MAYSMTGRTLDRTTIKNGMIVMITGASEIEIGPLEDLTMVYGESITDPNGIEIDIEHLIDENLTLSQTQSGNIKAVSPVREKETDMFSPRMNAFHGIFRNYVAGEIRIDTDG